MRRFLFLFALCARVCAQAEWDHLFSEDEDAALFHHVNVISGNLNLCLQDGVVQGAKSIPLFRTYSSAGALERDGWRKTDLDLREERGLLIQGGWSFFPHTNLLIEIKTKLSKMRAYLAERSGNIIEYAHPKRIEDGESGERMLAPRLGPGQCSGNLSGRTNPQNNQLFISIKEGFAILYQPDGGVRTYKGEKLGFFRHGDHRRYFYRLISEKLPSQHEIHYEYDHKKQLKRISVKNPHGDRTYAWVNIDLFKKSPPFHFQLTTSDAKSFEYEALKFKERDYLATVKSNVRCEEVACYSPGRKGTGARVEKLAKDGRTQLQVSYYLPEDEKTELKWLKNPEKKGLSGDKVWMIEAPLGPNGEMHPIARYWYCKEFTDVRDASGILTRFFHDGQKVIKIDNYDEKGAVYSSTQFVWEEERLRAKVKLNGQGEPILAKTFQYDTPGNVVEEVLWGNLTGKAAHRFSFRGGYAFSGAESLSKRISYDPELNLPLLEEEEGGPTTRFFYKSGTDLLTLRLTCDQEKIVKREIFEYDDDNLLVAEIIDDGASSNPSELSGATMRKLKRYTLDPHSGLAKTVRELYCDLESGSEILLKSCELSYSPENLVSREAVYDSTGTYRYTLHTDYVKGKVVRTTTPLGHENFYRYDSLGNLLESKEVGQCPKTYIYDAIGRPYICTEKTARGERTETSVYDAKGRLLKQIDANGNATEQIYDCFGRSLETKFSETFDDAGEVYSPTVHFTYDVQGNLASTTLACGERTETTYNAFRKPIEIREADGTCLAHTYNKNGTLQKTCYSDGTEIHYTYDLFQRMTSKTALSQSGETLSQERWEYSTFQLLSYTDPRGLKTSFFYDGAGRKILEEAHGRKKQFVYDALGFLERTLEGDVSHVQMRDPEGNVAEEWIEEASGRVENRMRFFYDAEGRKEKAIRLTARGEAFDHFAYDAEGRMMSHTNPEGSATEFFFTDNEKNALGQNVQQKGIVDALGNATIETFDALSRQVLLEKKDPQGKVVSREEYFYDRSGNRTRRVTSVFQKNRETRKIAATWQYDQMGRVIEEIEDGVKATKFAYDERGRLKTRTLADGTVLTHAYDGIGRLKELKSSDGTIHLLYFYAQGPEPTEIRDLVQKTGVRRTYNLFGELTSEISPLGQRYTWERDDVGRVTRFILPDTSSIVYTYRGNHLVTVERKSAKGHTEYAHHYTHFDENGHVHEESLIHHICGARTTRDLLERPIAFTSFPLRHEASYGPTNLVMETTSTLFGEKKYTYDALGQLEEEGSLIHNFDSIGNPVQCETGSCNEILSMAGCALAYDACGNPRERKSRDLQILYSYDALGRLTRIYYPGQKEIRYTYDPLSRLLSKELSLYKNGSWQSAPPVYFLYDQDREIGTLGPSGEICELKVLGLGIRGEIGAAVAIELQGKAYAPLHDFQGNIVALVDPDGCVVEKYEISAFGKEKNPAPPVNPWRFSSKRHDEGLVFFGQRFYDPTLGRWLTPDPAGFAEGPNLYLFVLNSPLNRLDLFGLLSHPNFPEVFQANIPIERFSHPRTNIKELIQCKGRVGEVQVDWVFFCEHKHKIQFTAEELNAGVVNIFDHLHELVPKEGMAVGLITAQNGIHTNLDKFTNGMCRSIVDKIPEGTLFIGMHLPHEGPIKDIWRATREIFGKETPQVCSTTQTLAAFSDRLYKINPHALWLHIIHSRAGVNYNRAFERLTPEQQAKLQKILYVYALGPAEPVPREYGFRAYNVYSEEDHVTGWAGYFRGEPKYDISFIPSRSNWLDKLRLHSDHGFMEKTYQGALQDRISRLRGQYGFYNDAVR